MPFAAHFSLSVDRADKAVGFLAANPMREGELNLNSAAFFRSVARKSKFERSSALLCIPHFTIQEPQS